MNPRLVRRPTALLLSLLAMPSLATAAHDDRITRPVPEGPKEEVSYTNDIAPLVSNYCTTCHHGKDPGGGFVLDTYEAVRRQVEEGDLLARINDAEDPMPPAGQMSNRQRQLFRSWAERGYVQEGDPSKAPRYARFDPPEIVPIDVSRQGFQLLEQLQGHWVGDMTLMGEELEWFAWDYRAIAPAHVHGIFEGGTLGNLFTSFFVADFRGTTTVMARNGGLLNGIYRTSYFVLDRVEEISGGTRYRLVDAYGGAEIMWMSLEFTGDEWRFRSYTSRFGMSGLPQLHMRFSGKRKHPELARLAAQRVGFPELQHEYRFPRGLPLPDWGPGVPVTSYSYMAEDPQLSLVELAKLSGDPIRIDQVPYLSRLRVQLEREPRLEEATLEVYLSRVPLTDAKGQFRRQYGFLREDVFDGILMFSQLSAGEEELNFTYLHPGKYFLTVIADLNSDGYPSSGDLTHVSLEVTVPAAGQASVRVPPLDIRN